MFIGELVIKPVQGKKWELVESLHFRIDEDTFIDIPKGFITDLASIPRVLTPFFPVHGLHTRAAVMHDWLYANKGDVASGPYTRKQADELFLIGMRALGVGQFKSWMMYKAVRLGGWLIWRDK